MFVFYMLALIPAIIGSVLWYKNRSIVWWEWIVGTVLAFVLSGIFHLGVLKGITDDIETWSGKVVKVTHYPEWTAEWQEQFSTTSTDSDGNVKISYHYETRTEKHYEEWSAHCTVNGEREIERGVFEQIKKEFGSTVDTQRPHKTDFDRGDPNIYVTFNTTGFLRPTTTLRKWENRIKAAPSVFSFSEVPEGIKIFPYPSNKNFLKSSRLKGTATKTVSYLEFDRLNSRLNPAGGKKLNPSGGKKLKVNLILVGFDSSDSQLGHWQEAKWVGGRKNDLVLTYGGTDPHNPDWSYVFGWTEKEIVKVNLANILLNNPIDDSILSLIEAEVRANYVIKDWSKFDYIKISPPAWSYYVFIFTMIIVQSIFWFIAHRNESTKDNMYGKRRGYYR